MDFERPLVNVLLRALAKRSAVFQVIIGPRQVGKTTIARQVLNKLRYPSVYASADAPLPPGPEWIETQWRLAEVELKKSKKPIILVLDEIQKVRGWGESLKRLWDNVRHTGQDIRLMVLGSSALLLNEGLTESLAGRYFLNRCYHWPYYECERRRSGVKLKFIKFILT